MTADGIAAAAAAVQAIAVLVALLYAHRQLAEASVSRREQSRPYVVVFLDFHPEYRHFPSLVVANFGTTAAYDVRLSFSPELRSSLDEEADPLREVGFVKDGIPALVPQQRMSTLFDSTIERPADWEDAYTVTATYHASDGLVIGPESFVLDLRSIAHSTFIDQKGLSAIHQALEKLRTTVERIGSGTLQPQVVVETVTEREQRQQRLQAERAARRAARQSPHRHEDSTS